MIREAGARNIDAVVALGGEDVRARTLRLIEHGGINAHDFVLVMGDPIRSAVLVCVEKDEMTAEAWLYGECVECEALAEHLRERLPGYVLDVIVKPGDSGIELAKILDAELLEELAEYTRALPAGSEEPDVERVSEGAALEQILDTHTATMPNAFWDGRRIKERLDQFLILRDNKEFGYAILARWNHEVYFFHPAAGREEVMLNACMHAASALGATELMVTAEPHEKDRRELFAKAGFEMVKETAAYRAQL